MKNLSLYIGSVLLVGCMANPVQPPLIENEKLYFSKLENQCHCNVDRELDPREGIGNPNNNGFYLILLNNLRTKALDNKDSLKKQSITIAKELHKSVLGKSFQFPYKDITVMFVSITINSSDKGIPFTYAISELE